MQHVAQIVAAIRSSPPPAAVIMIAFMFTEEDFDPSRLTLDPAVGMEEELGSGVRTRELGAGVDLSDGQLEAFAHEMAAMRRKWYSVERRGPVISGSTNKAAECEARYSTTIDIDISVYSRRQPVLRRNC